MNPNTCSILEVPEFLRNDVKCFIVNRFNNTKGTAIRVFPGGMPGIVFHHRDGYLAIEKIVTQSGHEFTPPTLFLHGLGLESSVMYFGGGSYMVIQVILKPYALKTLLGLNAVVLKDAAVDLNEISTEDMTEQMISARGVQCCIAKLTEFLASQFRHEQPRDALVEESLQLIYRSAGMIQVRTLLEHLDISERQFERRFQVTVGISPVSYIRLRRFNEAIRLMKTRQFYTLTEVAHALNFHDQSHFIREIKAFTGNTPKGLSQRVDEFMYNEAGYSHI